MRLMWSAQDVKNHESQVRDQERLDRSEMILLEARALSRKVALL